MDQAIDSNLWQDTAVPRARQAQPEAGFDEVLDQQFAVLDDQFERDFGETSTVDGGLTERQLAILDFEKQWWRNAGAKEQAIRDTFTMSATHYYQILNGVIDNPAALAQDPVTVGRLRRLRDGRSRSRAGLW
jgi:hypothetical protein